MRMLSLATVCIWIMFGLAACEQRDATPPATPFPVAAPSNSAMPPGAGSGSNAGAMDKGK
jgi:hypothetical protein